MKDYWNDRPDVVIRAHKVPRRELYIPTANEDDTPFAPIIAIDVTRPTRTNLEHIDDKDIGDVWCGDDKDTRCLSADWVAETVFDKLRVPPPGYEIICGR